MRRQTIINAIEAAERFLEAAHAANLRLDKDGYDFEDYQVGGTKETAWAKRSSMDLTRTLASLRRDT